MITEVIHGSFQSFNVTPVDAYLALRPDADRQWRLYRFCATSEGFSLNVLGQHANIGAVERVAEADAKHQATVRQQT